MQCRLVMSNEVQWVLPDQTVLQAAKLMDAVNLGWLPVCGEDLKPVGVLTDRDIALRVSAKGRSAARTRVAAVMTAPVHCVGPDWPVEQAAALMSQAGVRRLVVLDASGRIGGVVTLADLFRHAAGDLAVAAAIPLTGADRPQGESEPAASPSEPPAPEESPPQSGVRNEARAEAEHVAAGGANAALREFPP